MRSERLSNTILALCAVIALCMSIMPTVTGSEVVHTARIEGPKAGSTYYVSTAGNDSNDCSQATPCREIRKALTLMKPGDTALVADGKYKGFDIDGKNGAIGAPVSIKAQGSNAEVTPTTDRPDNRDTIFITSSSFIVIDGLRSFNANRAAVRVDSSDNVTIRNGTFGNNTNWGIFTDFSNDLLIEYNECYGSQKEHGIYVSNSPDRPVVRGNRVHNNSGNGLHFNGDISIGGDGLVMDALVEDNVIWGNGKTGGGGINMDGPRGSTIRNNVLYDNHASGITQYKIDAADGPKDDEIYHNTIDMASDARWALLIRDTAGPMKVRNNILYDRNPGHGGLSFGDPSDVNRTDSDHNIMDKVTPDDGNTIYTLAQWQALGHENDSLSATPQAIFVNATNRDYHLANASPAIDKGETLSSVTRDIEGNPRPMGNASDIGAYESGGAPNPVKVSASASPKYGIAPLNVSFAVSATGGTQPYTWSWEFGEGKSSTQQNPSHQYVIAGTYKANVTATDSSSQKLKGSATLTITVNASSPVLMSVTIYPKSIKVNSTNWMEFFASAFDQNGDQLKSGVAWSWSLSPSNIGLLNSSGGYNLTRFTAGNASVNGSISVGAKMGPITKTTDASISVTWCDCRGKPPFVNITRPNDQETVNGTVTIITEVSASVLKVEFYIDGTKIGVDQNPLFKYDWDTKTVPNGQHKIKVIAYNATGAQASDEITVNVDNHPNGGGGGTGKGTDQTLTYASIAIVLAIVIVLILIALFLRRRRPPARNSPEF